MFNSDIMDLAIGMIFVYLLLSLMCSAANEVIELWLKNRAADLEKGLRELVITQTVQDPLLRRMGNRLKGLWKGGSPSTETAAKIAADAWMTELYDHPLLNGLYEGTYQHFLNYKNRTALGRLIRRIFLLSPKLPSYIPKRNFALAIMDLVAPATVGISGAAGATDTRAATDGVTGFIASPPTPEWIQHLR